MYIKENTNLQSNQPALRLSQETHKGEHSKSIRSGPQIPCEEK
jgi:hypothetical protein